MASFDLIQQLCQCELFSGLSKEEVLGLSAHCRIRHLRRNEVLFHATDPANFVYVVLFGSVKIFRSNKDGKERIMHFLMQGELFGAAVALKGGVYPVTASGLEHTRLIEIAAPVFKSMFMKHPVVGQTLASQMAERVRESQNDRIAIFDTVEKRIAVFLIDLLGQSCKRFGPTTRIPIPLTRQDIADRVGTTVETVIRTLSNWSKENLIIAENKQLDIPHIQDFCRRIGVDQVS